MDMVLSIEILNDDFYMVTSSHDFCVFAWNLGNFQKEGVINMSNNFW